MAFEPALPTADDWIRDPVGSWGRLWQAFNYKLDAYKAGVAQIPLLEGKLAGYQLAVTRLPASPARTNLSASVAKLSTALTALKNSRTTLEGKVLQAISDMKASGAQYGQVVPSTASAGLGQLPVMGAVIIAGVALVMYGITQWLTQLASAVAQEKSVGSQVLQYAQNAGLTATQTQALLAEAAKVPSPTVPKDPLSQIMDAIPWILGLGAAIYFGPPLLGMLSKRRAA
jgi:hypothetical protein